MILLRGSRLYVYVLRPSLEKRFLFTPVCRPCQGVCIHRRLGGFNIAFNTLGSEDAVPLLLVVILPARWCILANLFGCAGQSTRIGHLCQSQTALICGTSATTAANQVRKTRNHSPPGRYYTSITVELTDTEVLASALFLNEAHPTLSAPTMFTHQQRPLPAPAPAPVAAIAPAATLSVCSCRASRGRSGVVDSLLDAEEEDFMDSLLMEE